VFLDLSLVQDSNLNQFSEFLSAVQELESNETVRFLLSISSGGRHPNNLDMGASNLQRYENILKKFQTVCINGFTKQQAKLCFESTNKNLTFEQVYPFTGCNPSLLCLVAKSVNLNQVTSCVSTKVENFMTWNLKLLKEGPGLVDHLMKQRLGETVQLAYMACREAPVDRQMEAKFMNSWLGKYHLAIVEDVSLETMTVLEDQDDKSATVPQGTAETKRIIRWNFPTLGTEYLDTVEHFVSNPDFKAKVNEICIKEPIFAGFWLENMFVSHYIHRTDITFDCTAAKYEKKSMKVTFHNIKMEKLLNSTTVQTNIMYELRRAHPIIDFVGNLTDDRNKEWLVFIQISLQSYTAHKKKLYEMLQRNSGNDENASWSLYTKYRNRFEVDYNDESKNVLMAYISPLDESLLEDLRKDFKSCSIKQNVHVGKLSNSASFYEKMKKFRTETR